MRIKYALNLTFAIKIKIAIIALLCYIPVSAVFTAVSMRPSLPPMAWKKNSLGVKPAKYEFSTNPLASGPWSSYKLNKEFNNCGILKFIFFEKAN